MGAELEEALQSATDRQEMCMRVKKVIVNRLELPIPPEWITDDQPLFGRGLELDSLDALELCMAMDAEFGVAVYDDDVSLFGSVSACVEYLTSSRPELLAKMTETLDAPNG